MRLLPEGCRWHHIAHAHVYGVVVPLIRRDVCGAPQQRRQVFAECHGLDLSRYQATRSLKYLLVSSLGERISKWQCSLFAMEILIVYSFTHSSQNSQKKGYIFTTGSRGWKSDRYQTKKCTIKLRGAAQEDLIRDAPPMYADGIVMAAGANRPSLRKIGNELFQQVRLK